LYVQSRTAARKELLDQATAPDECEKLYDESLWCLYALQDDLLQTGNPFMEEDRETIATCAFLFQFHLVLAQQILFLGIKRTKLRLVRCRARMSMNDTDRVNDARADQNLADVARIPAPWDVAKPASPSRLAHAFNNNS
jgi:serine/threonine-protein kinase ULK/ATG1